MYEATGNYLQTFEIGDVCDSVVTLHLNMIEAEDIYIDTIACEQLVWNDTIFLVPGLHQSTYISDLGCEGVANITLSLEYPPHPTNIYSHLLGHYVIPSTEYQVNGFEFIIADSIANNVWNNVEWSVSVDNWAVEPHGLHSCALYPYSYTADTVWLSAKVYGGCTEQYVERRVWLLCSFYGVDENEESRFVEIAPNPSRGEVSLRIDELKLPTTASLIDMRGQLVRKFNVISETMVLDLTALRKGMYFLVVEDGSRRTLKKIVLI